MSRLDFLTGQKILSSRVKKSIRQAMDKRRKGMPLAYVLKQAEFYGHSFFVTRDTLIPRPETELLAEEALKVLRPFREPAVLDIGTGCGCLAVGLTIARPDCRMTALDISKNALAVARKNIRRHGLEEKIKLVHSDLFNAFHVGAPLVGVQNRGAGTSPAPAWDLIVSNPPYVDEVEMPDLPREVLREPRVALDGGKRGLAVIERILGEAPRFLKKGGFLLMEIGAGQARVLEKRISKDLNYAHLRFIKDLAGIDRVLMVEKWIK